MICCLAFPLWTMLFPLWRSSYRHLSLRGPDRVERLLHVGPYPRWIPDLVAALARRRRPARQHTSDALGRSVRPPGPRMGQGQRRARHRHKAGERKHLIAQEYLDAGPVRPGVFLVLAARAPALVWKVQRSAAGRIVNLEKTSQYVNHYSFHIMDPTWGHVTIKMSGHPPFGAQVILNGH